MALFTDLWKGHPGTDSPCVGTHGKPFGENQCAISMSVAFDKAGVDLTPYHDETYTGPCGRSWKVRVCSANIYYPHDPAHIRGAHAFANMLYKNPDLISARGFTRVTSKTRSTRDAVIEDKRGLVFILNGWGSTDHIDLWDDTGATPEIRRGSLSYIGKGSEIWFWDLSHK